MIKVTGLTVAYSGEPVLKDISIGFENKMVHGIVGLNGAGKTTFFNTMSGMLKQDSGDIMMDENPLSVKDTGYLETSNFFYSKITGNEYLKIFRQTNPNFNLKVLEEVMKLPLDELVEGYSTGMKKKLALLGLLKQDKKIYLLDEPFNGLDLETNKVLELIISALKAKEKLLFVSSHIIEPLLHTCDYIHYLKEGRFIKTYTRDQYAHIEEDVFGALKRQMTELVNSSV